MTKISTLHARQILDSRGNPTIEVECTLDDGSFGRAAVPSGASTGTHEAVELRDNNPAVYTGKSVQLAVSNVCTIIHPALKNALIEDQTLIDNKLLDLDGTEQKSKLGANALLGVSMAVARARACSEGAALYESLAKQAGRKSPTLLPVPLMNVINGGKHADSGLSFQECMLVPTEFTTFSDALRAGVETFHTLKKLLQKAGYTTAVGDEGGFAPSVVNTQEAFDFLMQAITVAGYEGKIKLAIDAAASEFYKNGVYTVDNETFSSEELTQYYHDLCNQYPLISIEDSHSEDDWTGFSAMMSTVGRNVQLVGDDLLVTNTERIKQSIEQKAANSVLIKLNQIGTVTETIDAIKLAQDNNMTAVVSHRSGETEDTFIAHLAVALETGQIKTGSLSRSDRTAKYNQLLRIEERLGERARYQSAL
jgi:enolase